MIRPFYIWVLFGVCLGLATAAMGWVSWKALQLDVQTQRQAAMRRIRACAVADGFDLAPLIAQESARPYFEYQAFYPAERAYTRMYAELKPDEILLPSPLLTFSSPDVVVHFQIGPDGKFTSPQVPTKALPKPGKGEYVSLERVRAAAEQLAGLRKQLRTTCCWRRCRWRRQGDREGLAGSSWPATLRPRRGRRVSST